MYGSISPCDAARPVFLSAFASPCCLSRSIALATSPSTCSSARLHSMIPAPLFSRSSLTWFAVTTIYFALQNVPKLAGVLARPSMPSGSVHADVGPDRVYVYRLELIAGLIGARTPFRRYQFRSTLLRRDVVASEQLGEVRMSRFGRHFAVRLGNFVTRLPFDRR